MPPRSKLPLRIKILYHIWWKPRSELRYAFNYGWQYVKLSSLERKRFRAKIKHKKYPSQYLRKRKKIKGQLLSRDGHRCKMCKYKRSSKQLTIDHIVQISKGGSSELSNLQLLCRPCHNKKDNPSKHDATHPISQRHKNA